MSEMLSDQKFVSKLQQDVSDFFLGNIAGNLWPYVYGAPENENDPVRGGDLYNQVLANEKDYYLYEYESKLFQGKGQILTDLIGPNATFIELGPGSEKSLRLKTIPLLHTCENLQGYVGIDISQEFLDKALAVLSEDFPDISIQGICQDFTQLTDLPDCDNPVILFKGSTISNLRRDEVPMFISKLKQLIDRQHYLFIVHDANQDEASLMKAYDNKTVALFIQNIMYRIHRDANIEGLDPSAFRYQTEWKPEIHDLQHVLVATRPQTLLIGDHCVEIEAGQSFHMMSSFKYPVEVFKGILGTTGYKPIDCLLDDSKRLAAHLFVS